MTQGLRAGFLGLGNQGEPIARRILKAGFPLGVGARREATLAPFRGTGAQPFARPAELAAASDVLGVCVVNDDDVRTVLVRQGALDKLPPGAAEAELLQVTRGAADLLARFAAIKAAAPPS